MAAPALAVIGHNNPPDPFAAHEVNIRDLYDEAKNWLDGTAIASQEEADKVQELLRRNQEAEKAAEASRVEENKPYDQGKAAVQAKYAPLIADTKANKGLTVKITEGCKAVLGVWLAKVRAEQDAAAKIAREVAEKAAREAQEALAASSGNLEAREQADAAIDAAAAAQAQAKAAEKARPQATGYGRAATLRDCWVPTLTDPKAAASYFWKIDPHAFDEFLIGLAKAEIASGHRTIPGFTIENRPTVV